MNPSVQEISESLIWLMPELVISGIILLVTTLIILPGSHDKYLKPVMILGLLVVMLESVLQSRMIGTGEICCLFNTDLVVIHMRTASWKILLGTSMLLVVLFPIPYSLKRVRGEYYLLLLGVLLGGFILIMANHFLMVIIGLELMSLCSYMLTGLARAKGSVEAAIKYFLFGSAATAVTIYGISWFYGVTGQVSLFTSITNEQAFLSVSNWEGLFLMDLPGWIPFLIVVLISSGILFKISAAPWHLWVPDVYEETPIPIIAMFSVVPKLAGFAFLSRWVMWLQWPVTEIALLAMLTLAIGNFAALRQQKVKRMMGYSSIAHSGFLLLALLLPGDLSALFFYASIYVVMNIGAFLLINYYEREYRLLTFRDYNGTFGLTPFFGVSMLVFMIALTGLPPTAGFTSKFFVFAQVTAQFQASESAILLVALVFGIINAVVSLAYYVRIPFGMIFRKMNSSVIIFKKYTVTENFLCIILVLAVLILFFKPEWLMGWINSSSFAF